MSSSQPKIRTPALTGNVIYNWFSHPCPYRVHLDLHPTPPERTTPSATGRYLMERGNRHEARIFDEIRERHPDDWASVDGADDVEDREAEFRRRTERTRELMREGVGYIFHGFLYSEDGDVVHVGPTGDRRPSDLVFRGETDILMRVDEPSDLGTWSYVVGDVKSSRHAKLPQKMQVAFYSRLVGSIQGHRPTTGFIVTGDGAREEFAVDELCWTLDHFLEEEVHEYRLPENTFFHLESSCRFCHWQNHCSERAANEDDLSLIPGSRRSEKRALLAAGIPNRATLMREDDAGLRELGRRHGRRLDGFRDLKRAASAQEFKRAMVRQHPADSSSRAWGSMAAPDLWGHRGPVLLVASVPDHYRGDEAAMATVLARPDMLKRGQLGDAAIELFLARPNADEGEALRFLWTRCAEAKKLLARRNERAVVVFLDGGLTYRLRRLGASLARKSPIAASWTEQLLADSVVLPRFVDRALFLPQRARGVLEIAAALGHENADLEASLHDHPDLTDASERLRELAEDYGILPEALAEERDLRPIFVKEWHESGDECWAHLLRLELDRDLAAAVHCLSHILGLPR